MYYEEVQDDSSEEATFLPKHRRIIEPLAMEKASELSSCT